MSRRTLATRTAARKVANEERSRSGAASEALAQIRARALRAGEEEALLELLDGWPFRDGRRGRHFFRRYLEHDPAYEPRNVWVAEAPPEVLGQPPKLVSCVQVFPRVLGAAGHEIPAGGIGSVFTRPEWRRRGVAQRLLEAATRSMRGRGLEISLLLATRIEWYRRLGWIPWWPSCPEGFSGRWSLSLPEPLPDSVVLPGLVIRELDAERDLAAVAEIARECSQDRDGIVLREERDWRASLLLAGDPDETFLVASSDGPIVAYLRVARLDGRYQSLEWGRRLQSGPGLAALVELFLEALRRAPHQEHRLLLPPPDQVLARALSEHGCRLESERWKSPESPPTWMLKPLRRRELAQRAGCSPKLDAEELLSRVLPRDRFLFWPSDRF